MVLNTSFIRGELVQSTEIQVHRDLDDQRVSEFSTTKTRVQRLPSHRLDTGDVPQLVGVGGGGAIVGPGLHSSSIGFVTKGRLQVSIES